MIEEGGVIEFCEVEDGDYLQITHRDGEENHTILMTRAVALELAKEIFTIMGDTH